MTAALDAARELGAASVALPAISAGIFGYPPAEAARVIATAAGSWARDPGSVKRVLLVATDDTMREAFAAAVPDDL